MLEIAGVNQNDIVYDLGSGDGRIVVMAAKEFGARSIGIEADPFRARWSRFAIRRSRVEERARVIGGNFFDISLSDATVVTLYGGYKINMRIGEKLASELRAGTRVVSYRFFIEGWTPAKTDEDSSIYLYVA
ncbi:MAG: SAM-dependent methyltransferase [Candidatus Thorarchaeota archaeon]|nr:MAG: SAM-dependent methyltransferase [Candidatus Thorarchaeota archaeon]